MEKGKSGFFPAIAIAVLAATLPSQAETMKVRISIDGKEATATLQDNPTARDFVSLLPLELTLEDYGETEKIAYPPRKLSTEGAPSGTKPSAGDLSYYAPWGNLAIFRKDFRYSDGLINLGRVDRGLDHLKTSGSFEVKIDLMK
jgi:hypothetical protein